MRLPAFGLIGKLLRFGGVGGAATLVYAGLAWGLAALGAGATLASVLAYTLAALFAYVGHKRITFRSDKPHAAEVPRFAAAQLLGLAVATGAPLILSGRLHLPAWVPILTTCIAVPILNFVILDRLVFRRPAAPSA